MSNNEKLSQQERKKVAHHTKEVATDKRRKETRAAKKQLKRNQQPKPPRQKNWLPRNFDVSDLDYDDPDVWDEILDWDESEYTESERIMPLDEGDRRRRLERLAARPGTQNGQNARTSGAQSAAGNSDTTADDGASQTDETRAGGLRGRVLTASNGIYTVDLSKRTLQCAIRGLLSVEESGFTNPVAVGDRVLVSEDGFGGGVIEEVLPRTSVLARPDVFHSHLRQIIVANADQLLIVASWREPIIWFELIDRYLIAAARSQLPAILCVNKVDLAEARAECDTALAPYHDLGIRTVLTSAVTGEGIEEVQRLLRGKLTVLAGLSGVGKSSLLAAAEPGLDLRTGVVNEHSGEGRHTTTQATLFRLAAGGAVVDTPGIREFGLAGLTRHELAGYFPDIAELARGCRFNNCTHVDEPNCAVKTGVKRGALAQSRYHSYTLIHDSLS